MNSAYTIDLQDREDISLTSVSGSWHEGRYEPSLKTFGLARMAKVAGLALTLAVSPVTSGPDPWLIEKRRRDTALTQLVYREVVGRFISRSEALAIVREILAHAEKERLAIAMSEAAIGIQWKAVE